MSVSDLAAAVDRVRATRPTPALREADGCLDEAANVLAVVSTGSAAPELVEAVEGLLRAREGLAQVQQTCSALSEVLGQYLAGIGVGSSGAVSSTPIRPPSTAPRPEPTSTPDPALIAEVLRQGHKISPERVVRIARLPDDRIVWLEEGDKDRGLRHILEDDRVQEFATHGINRSDIVDILFAALEQGELIGRTGKDRLIYELHTERRPFRVAVSIGSNGYIVGANPFSTRKKPKPL